MSVGANQNIGTSDIHVTVRPSPTRALEAPSSSCRNKKRKFSMTPVPMPQKSTTEKKTMRGGDETKILRSTAKDSGTLSCRRLAGPSAFLTLCCPIGSHCRTRITAVIMKTAWPANIPAYPYVSIINPTTSTDIPYPMAPQSRCLPHSFGSAIVPSTAPSSIGPDPAPVTAAITMITTTAANDGAPRKDVLAAAARTVVVEYTAK
mmetsp:Transcript_7985/g.20469  ORF Transcript_7985/g.20469 Transcript_7985/m.20469 type:complete len:205 (-) Transcript_7985:42-656(-)